VSVPGRRPPALVLVAVAIIAFAALLLWAPRTAQFGQGNDVPRLVLLLALFVFVGAGLFGRALRPGEIIRGMLAWSLAIVFLAGAYANRDQLAGFAGRLLGAIAPGVPISGRLSGNGNPDSVTVVRAGDGHFAVLGAIDEKPILFLVDTGASFVTLTRDDARQIGIDVDGLDYRLPIRTANGTMIAAAVTLDRLAVGPIERRNLKALVAPEGVLDQSLLGMTFLDTLSGYSISGDRLVLSP
jgi:aspartyl protease family protein